MNREEKAWVKSTRIWLKEQRLVCKESMETQKMYERAAKYAE